MQWLRCRHSCIPLQEQVAECSRHLSNEFGFNPKDPEGFYFVGFRKVTEKDKKELSFKDEDPPWLI